MTTTPPPPKPCPVVDGDTGAVDTYGHATTARGAMRVARRTFAEPVVDAYFQDSPITLADGTVIRGAWVAVTREP